MKHIIYFLLAVVLMSCATRKIEVPTTPVEGNTWSVARTSQAAVVPSLIVYKTRADYSNLVPVIMDVTASRIVSYPDPADLYRADGSLRTPTQLNNGYLLDNKGVTAHTAFLDYTYDCYIALDSLPDKEEMLRHVLDKHPFVEMWDCGKITKYNDRITELNNLIDNNMVGCRNIIYNH